MTECGFWDCYYSKCEDEDILREEFGGDPETCEQYCRAQYEACMEWSDEDEWDDDVEFWEVDIDEDEEHAELDDECLEACVKNCDEGDEDCYDWCLEGCSVG